MIAENGDVRSDSAQIPGTSVKASDKYQDVGIQLILVIFLRSSLVLAASIWLFKG